MTESLLPEPGIFKLIATINGYIVGEKEFVVEP
jgi:hypothetical protein